MSSEKPYTLRQKIGLGLGPSLFFLILLSLDLVPRQPQVTRTAASAVWIAVWWITEAVPIPVTSLLPLALFPLLSIMKGGTVAANYMNSSIFLFMGGFLIALGIEKWRLHRRIALTILKLLGDRPHRLILGFMIATAFLSMWISNTATAMMMLPIALAIISKVEDSVSDSVTDARFTARFATALLLAVAYAASIGGIGTLIGTPPNIAFVRIYAMSFPQAPPVTFVQWFLMALPFVIVFLGVVWFMLVRVLVPFPNERISGGSALVRQELRKLGSPSSAEKRMGIIFGLTALLWITRVTIDLGFMRIPGWADLLGIEGFVDDGTVAVVMGILLFLIPSGSGDDRGLFLLDWHTALKLPWGILLLFGGGFALADGFQRSGLSEWLGGQLVVLTDVPKVMMIASTATLLTFMTELTSNTSTTQLILPILVSLAVATKTHPLLLMLPATISASCAFMLPVGTPPNAIVFGSGRVPIVKMATVGIVLNLIGVVLVTALILLVATPIFQLSGMLPEWVK